MDLTYRQRLFVEAYLGEANGNGTRAAQMAGFGAPNVAAVAAHRLLRNAKIAALIEQRVASAAMPANEVLARLSEYASADLGNYLSIHDDGTFQVNLSKARKSRRTRAIKKVKTKTRTVSTDRGDEVEVQAEIELHNPLFALDKLAQYHGLYAPRSDDGGTTDAKPPRIVIPDVDERYEHTGPAEAEGDGGDVPA